MVQELSHLLLIRLGPSSNLNSIRGSVQLYTNLNIFHFSAGLFGSNQIWKYPKVYWTTSFCFQSSHHIASKSNFQSCFKSSVSWNMLCLALVLWLCLVEWRLVKFNVTIIASPIINEMHGSLRVVCIHQGLAWVPTKFTNKSKDWPGVTTFCIWVVLSKWLLVHCLLDCPVPLQVVYRVLWGPIEKPNSSLDKTAESSLQT